MSGVNDRNDKLIQIIILERKEGGKDETCIKYENDNDGEEGERNNEDESYKM